jgi:FKBP-type peptidyl-prolyl cis-trans isomerase FkpA
MISSLRSKLPMAVVACALLGAGAGCINEPSAPKCVSTSLTQIAMRGDTVVLNTGLRYIETKGGAGEAIQWCRGATVHYTAYLANGTRLESSRDLDIPLAFTPGLGDLIDGFEQGVIGLRAQGTRRVIVPPELGYGAVAQQNSGSVVIPANSTLIYDIEALTTQ